VRRSGVVEGVGTVDEDVQGAVFGPLHDLPRALAPFARLLSSAADGYEADPVRLFPQADRRDVPARVAIGDEGTADAQG
jgi:hypothetical protein